MINHTSIKNVKIGLNSANILPMPAILILIVIIIVL